MISCLTTAGSLQVKTKEVNTPIFNRLDELIDLRHVGHKDKKLTGSCDLSVSITHEGLDLEADALLTVSGMYNAHIFAKS